MFLFVNISNIKVNLKKYQFSFFVNLDKRNDKTLLRWAQHIHIYTHTQVKSVSLTHKYNDKKRE